MASVRWVKILAWFSAIISGWLLIGGLVPLFLYSPVTSIFMKIPILGSFILLYFLVPYDLAMTGFINIFAPNTMTGFIVSLIFLFLIFSGSIYLIKRK